MGFTNQEREAFLALFQDLGPDAAGHQASAFVDNLREASIKELSAVPGFDQVRAGLARTLREQLDGDERVAAESACRLAIQAYLDSLDTTDFDPLLLLARHPAWVAIASMELDRWSAVPLQQSIVRAVAIATAGFAAVGDGQATGRGEVLWAIAEQADDAGWTQTATQLYESAIDAPFATDEGQSQVRLLLALRWVEDGDPRADQMLSDVAENALATRRSRIHAAWVLAAMRAESGHSADALRLLETARSLVDDDEEAEIGQRIEDAIATLQRG